MEKKYKNKIDPRTRKSNALKQLLLSFLFSGILMANLYSQQTYTFTNAGATGNIGPTLSQATLAYSSTNLNGSVTVVGQGVQQFTVPVSGGYEIECIGASGGATSVGCISNAGLGASMKGTFTLTAGQVIRILVGQQGNTNGSDGGGGGGSYVVSTTSVPLIVAGGGGGATNDINRCGTSINPNRHGLDATITTTAANSANGLALGGVNGNGGAGAGGGGGGGFTTDGTPAGTQCGKAYMTTALGGTGGGASGGFGGGGVGFGTGGNGGGGGGYSGGGTSISTTPYTGGGGGGSYNSGVNQVNTVGVGTGHGRVIIRELCSITLTSSGTNSLNPSICSGQSVTLTTNAVSNYSWSNGNTTANFIVVTPAITTVYSLSATSPSNCTAAKQITVIVNGALPVLSVTSSTNQTCLGKSATLTASGAVTYTWTNGVTNGVSFFPSATNAYTVTGENGCGTSTAVTTISVNPIPVTLASSAASVCTNKTATLTVTAPATSYTWQPGNIVGASPNLIVNPQVNTTYTTIASDGTCSGTSTVSIIANPVPTITSATSATIVCPGNSVNLSASGGVNYTWSPGGANGSNISVSPNVTTLYSVVGDNNFGCLHSSSQVIVAGAQPTLVLTSGSSTICYGSSTTLNASGAHTYSWTNGPATATNAVNPNVTTTYTATGTYTSSGCSDSQMITVSVYDPSVTIAGNSTICAGDFANLNATGGGNYVWEPGTIPFPSISVSPASNVIYTVSTVGTLNGVSCPISGTVEVIVNPSPSITAVPTKTAVCTKETNTVTASGANTYTWITTTTTVISPTITLSSNNAAVFVYTVNGTNANGCQGGITIALSISGCVGINDLAATSERLLIYPNPNNGEFVIESYGDLDLRIINELGQVLKQLSLNEKNGHKIYVSDLPNGIYFVVGDKLSAKIAVSK